MLKWLNKKWLSKDTNNLIVKEINESQDIPEALGITKEREQQLVKTLTRRAEDAKSYTHAMEMISKECLHANELGYSMMILGQMMANASIQKQLKEQGMIKDD